MKLINPSHKIESITPNAMDLIEKAARTCYQSKPKETETIAIKSHSLEQFVLNEEIKEEQNVFIKNIIKNNHLSVLEHAYMTVRFITDRGTTHELVRHRIASFSQESTRYVKYNGEMEFIKPWWYKDIFEEQNMTNESCAQHIIFKEILEKIEKEYKWLLEKGMIPQDARQILPNALKTEIVVTANFREWLHIFKLRISPAAHPEISKLLSPLLKELQTIYPVIFNNE